MKKLLILVALLNQAQSSWATEACTSSTIPQLNWPLLHEESEYRKDLLPFGDAWCNHRIVHNNQFNSSALLDPAAAYDMIDAPGTHGDYKCWRACGGSVDKSWIHAGIDISMARTLAPGEGKGQIVGTPVYPVHKGTVVLSQNSGAWLNVIVIDHEEPCGFRSVYWHLGTRYVNTGDSVETETILGTVGDLSYADPNVRDLDHLHLGIRLGTGGAYPQLGALPPSDFEECDGDSDFDVFLNPPAGAPYGFVDPAQLSYQRPLLRDVSCDNQKWYTKSALSLAEKKILEGRSGRFEAEGTITRAEFLKLVLKSTGRHAPVVSLAGHWAGQFIAEAIALEIIEPVATAQEFRPDDAIVREEAAQFLSRSVTNWRNRNHPADFADIASTDQIHDDLRRLSASGIITGSQGVSSRQEDPDLTYFRPNDHLNRAEAAELICRVLDLHGSACDYTCNS